MAMKSSRTVVFKSPCLAALLLAELLGGTVKRKSIKPGIAAATAQTIPAILRYEPVIAKPALSVRRLNPSNNNVPLKNAMGKHTNIGCKG